MRVPGAKALNEPPPVPSRGQLQGLKVWTDRQTEDPGLVIPPFILCTSNKDVEAEQARKRLKWPWC